MLAPGGGPEGLVGVRGKVEGIRRDEGRAFLGIERGGGPRPVFGMCDKSGCDWIVVDVFEFLAKIGGATKDEIKIAALPNRAFPAPGFGNLKAGSALPILHQSGKEGLICPEQEVCVIGHHDASKERKFVFASQADEFVHANIAFGRGKRRNISCLARFVVMKKYRSANSMRRRRDTRKL